MNKPWSRYLAPGEKVLEATEALKCCPFCGGETALLSSGEPYPELFVSCKGRCMRVKGHVEPKDACRFWNSRDGWAVTGTAS